MMTMTRGMTLMELVVASALAAVLIWGITAVDIGRVRMHEEVLRSAGPSTDPAWTSASLTIIHIARHLENADRVNLVGSDNVQFRIPIGLTFDAVNDYRWDQYRYDSARRVLRFYSDTRSGCGSAMDLAGDIGSVQFQPADEATPPPGGEPPRNDSNVLAYEVGWDDGAGRSQIFRSEVTLRGAAYTDVPTGLQDPSLGDVNAAPAACNT